MSAGEGARLMPGTGAAKPAVGRPAGVRDEEWRNRVISLLVQVHGVGLMGVAAVLLVASCLSADFGVVFFAGAVVFGLWGFVRMITAPEWRVRPLAQDELIHPANRPKVDGGSKI
jgi:hypothetical protein